jgi:putative FmdB family regulatory protein
MPIYEYQCLSCGKKIEILQRMDGAPPACPSCGGEVKKLISSPAFHLKGSGWYATDYGGKKGAGSAESKPEGKSEGSSEGKSESKSEGKSEGKPESKPEKAAASESKGSGGGGGSSGSE